MRAAVNGGVSDTFKHDNRRHSGWDFLMLQSESDSSSGSFSASSLLTSVTEWHSLPDAATALAVGASGLMATSFAAVSLATTGHGRAVAVACIPWLPQFWFQDMLEQSQPTQGTAIQEATAASSRARSLSNALCWTSLGQAVCGMFEFVLDDPLSGLIAGGIATLGLQSATPAGYRFLPTYIVLAFCNGTMQTLMAAELWLSHGHLGTLPAVHGGIMGKAAVYAFVSSPVLMFAGLAVAWQLYDEQQRAIQQITAPAPTQERRPGSLRTLPRIDENRREDIPARPDVASTQFTPFTGVSFRLLQDPTNDDMTTKQ